ncbi:unnamed protein product [Schistosoma curassoni]|uniref:Ovule protein n=1 Tax=Schistosoma curassoni TaxID=6186 RepID=A0A183JHK6_9TREM|nr:unnamed protein product [Schistosoma curassoni]
MLLSYPNMYTTNYSSHRLKFALQSVDGHFPSYRLNNSYCTIAIVIHSRTHVSH